MASTRCKRFAMPKAPRQVAFRNAKRGLAVADAFGSKKRHARVAFEKKRSNACRHRRSRKTVMLKMRPFLITSSSCLGWRIMGIIFVRGFASHGDREGECAKRRTHHHAQYRTDDCNCCARHGMPYCSGLPLVECRSDLGLKPSQRR